MGTKKPTTKHSFTKPPANLSDPAPPATDPTAALAALSAEVTTQIGAVGEQVGELTERITANDKRSAKFEQSVHDKFEALKQLPDAHAELADRLEKDEELIKNLDKAHARAAAMGSKADEPQLSNAFANEIATGDGMAEYRRMCEAAPAREKRITHRFKVKNPMPFTRAHGFAGESTVIINNDLIGDASDPVVQAGLTELIRDPIGLVDVVNEVPGVPDADQFKEMVEDLKSSMGFVVAAANGAQTGGSSALDYVTVHNTEGFYVGQKIYVWATATGQEGPFTISAITAGTTLTFATSVIDFNVADGDLVTGEEFVATAESGIKPAGMISASMKSVDIQTLATYLILTRQALRRTNLFDLGAWAGQRLPVRLREVIEWHLLYGSGTAPQLHGFLNSTQMTAFGVETDTWSTDLELGGNRADLLLWSAANIPGSRPIVCVMHKLDWFKLTNAKNLNGDYVHGAGEGPAIINTPMLKAIGGLRVVLSSKIAQSYALVMDAAQASSFARINDAEMVVGYVNDQLISNQQTMLYEQSFGHLLKVGTAWRRAYLNAPPV